MFAMQANLLRKPPARMLWKKIRRRRLAALVSIESMLMFDRPSETFRSRLQHGAL